MATENLQIPDILEGQDDKEATANAAHNLLDRALNNPVQKAITVSTSFTATETQENTLVELTGTPGSAFTVDMPDAFRRRLTVFNNTDAQATIRNSAAGGAGQPVIGVGLIAEFSYDGTDFIELSAAQSWLGLTDTDPTTFAGQAGKAVIVNSGETGLELGTGSVGGGASISLGRRFTGAKVGLDSSFAVPVTVETPIPWDSASEQVLHNGLKFWLGADLTFAVASLPSDTVTATAHSMATGDGPFEVSTTTTLPAGLAASTDYWCIRVDADTMAFATSYANAVADTRVDITDNGTGTHTINRETRIVAPFGVRRMEINFNGRFDNVATTRALHLFKNGAADADLPFTREADNRAEQNGSSGSMLVISGDWFDLRVSRGGTAVSMITSNSWILVEATEVADVGSLSDLKNSVVNGDAQVVSRGTLFDTASVFTNADASVLIDQHIYLSEGSDTMDVSQEATVIPTGGNFAWKYEVETANEKFAHLHILTAAETKKYIDGKASLSFKMRTTTGFVLSDIRASVISWDSTADAPTRDVVSTWNAVDVDPTLVANWTYEVAGVNLPISVDAYVTVTIENVDIDTTNTTNIALFIWLNDTTTTVGDLVYISDIQLEPSSVSSGYQRRTLEEERLACAPFLDKSFDPSVTPAQNAGIAGAVSYRAIEANVQDGGAFLRHPTKMFKDATFVFYNPSRAAATWENITGAAASGAASLDLQGEGGAHITNAQLSGDAVGDLMAIHYLATAEM